jgi:hypothetical protein
MLTLPFLCTKEMNLKKAAKYFAIALGVVVGAALFQRNKNITRGNYKKSY